MSLPIEAEKDAIRHLYRWWSEAVRAGAIDELLRMVTDDALFWPESSAELIGAERFRAVWEGVFARFVVDQTFREEEIVVSGNIAFVRGFEGFVATPRDGGPSQEVHGRRAFSLLQCGADGRWRFARGMSNSFRPPA